MILDAGSARWLLVLHTALGVAAVAASTHLCVWLVKYLRGGYGKRRAVQRFAFWALVLHAAAFLVGNLAYPTYKTRVRAEYLDSPAAVGADVAREVAAAPGGAARAARWFDSKEHWVAVGLALALAVFALVRAWDPERDGKGPAPFVAGAAFCACATLWLAAVVGVLTATWRAI